MRVAFSASCVLGLVCAVVVSGCFNTPAIDKGPYGNYCPLAPTGEHHCGICFSTSQCVYCPDRNGQVTCSADVCKSTCDSTGSAVPLVPGYSGGGGSGGSGGGIPAQSSGGSSGSGGGSGGSSGGGGGGCNSTCPAACPADAQLECSQYTPIGTCSIQSCTCYGNSPTAYCGIFYRSSSGGFWWCGGGYNMSCSAIGVQQCAMNVASACQ